MALVDAPSLVSARTAAPELVGYMGRCRDRVVDEIKRIIPADGRYGETLYGLMLDYPLREAKGLRPTLSLATCRALGGKDEAVLPSAAVLELYHNAFLIHDDVEDESVMRRGAATLHRQHGVPVAINVGDAMFCLCLEPLLDNIQVLGLGPALRILQAVRDMTRESVEGQAQELDWVKRGAWDVTDADYVRMVEKKTGWYSFITPLRIGAITAGADDQCIETLGEFGRRLSIAFQIQDDVLSLRGKPEAFGKEIGGDLWEGKRTLILLQTMRQATRGERDEIARILLLPQPFVHDEVAPNPTRDFEALLADLVAKGQVSDEGRKRLREVSGCPNPRGTVKTQDDVQRLYELVRKYRAIDYATRVAAEWAVKARRTFQDDLAPLLGRSFYCDILEALVDFVHERTR